MTQGKLHAGNDSVYIVSAIRCWTWVWQTTHLIYVFALVCVRHIEACAFHLQPSGGGPTAPWRKGYPHCYLSWALDNQARVIPRAQTGAHGQGNPPYAKLGTKTTNLD